MTLRDFKAAVDRQGNFRYHFKALDPEFGTVKEEVGEGGKLQSFLLSCSRKMKINTSRYVDAFARISCMLKSLPGM